MNFLFTEAILIVPASQKLLFTATVSKLGLNLKFEIAEVNEDDDLGTADALRLIAPRIKVRCSIGSFCAGRVRLTCISTRTAQHRAHSRNTIPATKST